MRLTTRPHAVLTVLAAITITLLLPQGASGKDDPPGQSKKQGGGQPAADNRVSRPSARDVRIGAYFNLSDRNAASVFYEQRYAQTRSCPPGLAKKNNGCLPPGQAKKYAVGQRLPADVVVYTVPHGVLVRLPPVPADHRYVRVAADILLIAIGTQMVVDALTDLVR